MNTVSASLTDWMKQTVLSTPSIPERGSTN